MLCIHIPTSHCQLNPSKSTLKIPIGNWPKIFPNEHQNTNLKTNFPIDKWIPKNHRHTTHIPKPILPQMLLAGIGRRWSCGGEGRSCEALTVREFAKRERELELGRKREYLRWERKLNAHLLRLLISHVADF